MLGFTASLRTVLTRFRVHDSPVISSVPAPAATFSCELPRDWYGKPPAFCPDSLRSDSGDDEIEHASDPLRVRRILVHHHDSVDQSYHVDTIHIHSDLFCGLGTVQ